MRSDLEGAVSGAGHDSLGARASIAREDLRAIAKEAFVYGFPMVEAYKTLHA